MAKIESDNPSDNIYLTLVREKGQVNWDAHVPLWSKKEYSFEEQDAETSKTYEIKRFVINRVNGSIKEQKVIQYTKHGKTEHI